MAVQIKDQLRRWDKLRVELCYAPMRQCWSHREPFDTDGTSRGTSPGTGGGVNSGEMAQQTSTSSAEPSQHEDVSSDAGALVKVRQGGSSVTMLGRRGLKETLRPRRSVANNSSLS